MSAFDTVKKLEEEYVLLKKTSEGRQLDFEMLKDMESKLNSQCAKQQKEISELHLRCAALEGLLKQKSKSAEEEKHALMLRLIEKDNKISDFSARFTEMETQLNQKVSDVLAHCADLETQLNEKNEIEFKEQVTQQQLLDENEQLREKLKNDYQSKFIQLTRQEQKISRYSEALNQWRTYTKSLSVQVAKELEAARTIHPLQDYLALTEFELSKIQVQLLKTPALSADRASLENCVNQLVEQKDFLRNVIDVSKQQLEKRAQALKKIIQSEGLSLVPPPPPLNPTSSLT